MHTTTYNVQKFTNAFFLQLSFFNLFYQTITIALCAFYIMFPHQTYKTLRKYKNNISILTTVVKKQKTFSANICINFDHKNQTLCMFKYKT